MSTISYVKCQQCNTLNVNQDYCTKCGSIISYTLKSKIENEKRIAKKLEEERQKEDDGPSFLDKATQHPSVIIRWSAQIVYKTGAVIGMIVGAVIAAVIGVAAG